MSTISQPLGVVLLVGGCGFIGHHIIQDLINNSRIAKSQHVHVFDRNIDEDRPFYSKDVPPKNYHHGDICDVAKLEEVFRHVRPSVVLDLVSPPMFDYTREYYMKINVEARHRLLDIARKTGSVKAFVFNSSAGVVHDSYSDLRDADESLPVLFYPQQSEPYSHSKAVAETMVLDANRTSFGDGPFMLTVSIRMCSPFGDNHNETTNVIIENARAGKQRFQIGKGTNLSDWTYIANGARAFVLAAQKLLIAHNDTIAEDMQVEGQAFFVTNGEPIPFWDFTRALGSAAGYHVERKDVRIIPRWAGMTMAFISEWATWLLSFGQKKAAFTRQGVRYSTITRYHRIDKAARRLGYKPHISLREGIELSALSWRNGKKHK